jgi:hypothetical protein
MTPGDDVKLKEHFDDVCRARMGAIEKTVCIKAQDEHDFFMAKIEAIAEATRLQAKALEAKFESVNEFRGALTDLQQSYVTRLEHEAVLKDIRDLRESRSELAGKASQNSANAAMILGGLGLLLGLGSMLVHLLH